MHELLLSSSSSPPLAKKATGSWKVWRKSLKYKGDWVQEVQGTMMLVATVIATVSFQAVINPPGGVWQQDIQENDGYKTFFPAGTAIMAYKQPEVYWFYLMANMVSFLASVTVVLLIISRFPLKNLVCSWMLGLAMCVAVTFLACGYLVGVQMVNINSSLEAIMTYRIYTGAVWLWVVVVGVVGLCYIIRFLIWLVKCAYRTFSSKDITSNNVTPLDL